MTNVLVPAYTELLLPALKAIRSLGGSGSIDEIVDAVLQQQGFTEQQLQALHGSGPQTEIQYRLAWARTYLKGMGLLENSQRGVWSLTEKGQSVADDELMPLHRDFVAKYRARRQGSSPGPLNPEPTPAEDDDSVADWRGELLDALMSMAPDAFERLAQRLLREAGFVSATVTGRSGDGGIDGLGTYRMSLLSFPVFFQCKRYKGSVGSGAVRDFRGAMAGRGDKGLLITTGTFTGDAKAEAVRDGAPPVDLIDGQGLCDLLRTYELGVRTTTREVHDITVNRDFFHDL